jgi:hypothetical protein
MALPVSGLVISVVDCHRMATSADRRRLGQTPVTVESGGDSEKPLLIHPS